ncbi:hypothetical protein [Streptomyces sp. NPDC051364]
MGDVVNPASYEVTGLCRRREIASMIRGLTLAEAVSADPVALSP